MDRVWDDAAISDKYEFMYPAVQFYSLPGEVGVRVEQGRLRWSWEERAKLRQQLAAMTEDEREKVRVKRVGVLTRVFQAAAISCRGLKREALATPVKKSGHRAKRPVTRRGDAKKAGQSLPSLGYPRSRVKRAIRIILTNNPDARDRQVCLQLDDDGIEVSDSKLKTKARGFQEMYDNNVNDRHKIEVVISEVRGDMRKHGLL
jgi:hypothetical protein